MNRLVASNGYCAYPCRLAAINQSVDKYSMEVLLTGPVDSDGATTSSAAAGEELRNSLTVWFGRVLGRRSNAVVILQQEYVVVSGGTAAI